MASKSNQSQIKILKCNVENYERRKLEKKNKMKKIERLCRSKFDSRQNSGTGKPIFGQN